MWGRLVFGADATQQMRSWQPMRLSLPRSMANALSIRGWEIAASAAAAAAVDVYVDIHICLCVSRRETARARA